MSLDVYGLTRQRDLSTINRFLDEYVDRANSEDRGDEEIGLEPLNPALEGDAWQWEPALTLTHIVERGLDRPHRAFTAYLTSNRADIERVMLSFTRDDQMVLGFSVGIDPFEPEGAQEAEKVQEASAKQLLADLAEGYHCHLGVILAESPPPSSEADFRAAPDELPTVYFTTFDVGWRSD